MKLIFFGAPGAGKGTVAKIISEKDNIIQISTGDLFRDNIKNKTILGKKVSSILDAGNLVPDDLTISIVKDRIQHQDCKNGYILDGFPRTLNQAKEWDKIDPVDKAVYFDITDEDVKKRLGGRRICPKCGAIYNIYSNKSKKEGFCDNDNETLITRKDDQIDAIENRLKVYHEQTKPLIKYYGKLNKLATIDSSVSPEESYKQIMEQLGIKS